MMIHHDWVVHIKKLLDTQRFIFLTFVSDQSLIEQFDCVMKNQQLFLEQNLSSPSVQNEQNFRNQESCKAEDNKLANELDHDFSEIDTEAVYWKEEEKQEAEEKEGQKSIKEDCERDSPDVDAEQKVDNEMCKIENHNCKVCGENFKTENLLSYHYSQEHDIYKQFECPAIGCIAKYKKIKSLDEHTRHRHKDEKIFECKNCSEMFELKSQLRYHTKTAHGNLFTCIDCGVVFVSKLKLRNHRRENHPTILEKNHILATFAPPNFNMKAHLNHTNKKYM